MPDAKVVFLTGLPDAIVDVVTSYSPAGFTTTVVDGRQPEAEQIEAVSDADFIMVYRAELSDNVLQAAPKARMVQLLSAGYDAMNLKLMRELEIPCANNGGANSWAVADHAVLLMLSLISGWSSLTWRRATADGTSPSTATTPSRWRTS